MRLVLQPRGSRQCGQACIAMLTNMPLEEVVGAVGDRPMGWRAVHTALHTNGIIADAALESAYHPDNIPPVAVLQLPTGDSTLKHLVVVEGDTVYDPGRGALPLGALDWDAPGQQNIIKFAAIHQQPNL